MSTRGVVTSVGELICKLRNTIDEHGIMNLGDFSAPLYLAQDFETLYGYIQNDEEMYERGLPSEKREYSKWCICEGGIYPSVYVLMWPPNSSTVWHGHPLRGCLFYLLDGEMIESLPDGSYQVYRSSFATPSVPVCVESSHKMVNGNETSVSLHIYWNDFVGEQ